MKRRHVRNMPSLFLLRSSSVYICMEQVWSRHGVGMDQICTARLCDSMIPSPFHGILKLSQKKTFLSQNRSLTPI